MKFRYFVALCATLLLPQATYPLPWDKKVEWGIYGALTTLATYITFNIKKACKDQPTQTKTRAPQATQKETAEDEMAQSPNDSTEKKSPIALINQERVVAAPEDLLKEIIENSTQEGSVQALNLAFVQQWLKDIQEHQVEDMVNLSNEEAQTVTTAGYFIGNLSKALYTISQTATQHKAFALGHAGAKVLRDRQLENLSSPIADNGAGVGDGVPQLTYTPASDTDSPQD